MFGLKLNEIAAWYAAIIATIVFLWDIYKWLRTDARIRVSVVPNMILIDNGLARTKRPDEKSSPHSISVEVVNIGGKKTTLTHITIYCYASLWTRVRGKPLWQGVVPNPCPGKLPFELDVGARWLGLIEQDASIESGATTGRLYIGVTRATSRRPHLSLVSMKRK